MMINQLAVNPIGNYQQLIHHLQQQVPTLMPPIQQISGAVGVRHVDDATFHLDQNDSVELHTLVDYAPWLKHLYLAWQTQLKLNINEVVLQHTPQEPLHWHPESTASTINALALAYSGQLLHRLKQEPILVVNRITLLWRDYWLAFRNDVANSHVKQGVLQALDHTAYDFQQFWLESWLHLAELQRTLPSTTTEISANST